LELFIKDFSKTLFFSAIGITLGSINNRYILKNNRVIVIILSTLFLYLSQIYFKSFYLFFDLIKFGIGAASLFILFLFFPINYLQNKYFRKIISKITNYTAGVYYLHLHIMVFLGVKGSLFGCFLNYLTCYFICLIGNIIFKKNDLKYLFI
jgi:hypothetical protein